MTELMLTMSTHTVHSLPEAGLSSLALAVDRADTMSSRADRHVGMICTTS